MQAESWLKLSHAGSLFVPREPGNGCDLRVGVSPRISRGLNYGTLLFPSRQGSRTANKSALKLAHQRGENALGLAEKGDLQGHGALSSKVRNFPAPLLVLFLKARTVY